MVTTIPLQKADLNAIPVTVTQNSWWGYLVLFLAPLLLGAAFLLYKWLTIHSLRWHDFAVTTTEGVVKGAWATAAVFSFLFVLYSYFYLYDIGRGPGTIIASNSEANRKAVAQAVQASLASQGKAKEKVEVRGNLSHEFQVEVGNSSTPYYLAVTSQGGGDTGVAQLQKSLPFIDQLIPPAQKTINDVGGDDSGGSSIWGNSGSDHDDWVNIVPLS